MYEEASAGKAVLLFVAMGSWLLTAEASSANEIVVQPGGNGQDVWITSYYSYSDDYGVDDERLRVGGWGDEYWALLHFDLAGLPAEIQSASIQLFAGQASGQAIDMILDEVTSPWDESTGWPDRPSFAQVRSLPAAARNAWYSINVTDLYRDWIAGSPNYGIQLRPGHFPSGEEFNEFRSSDYIVDPSERPKLVVVVAAGSAVPEVMTLDPSEITQTSARLNGSVSSDGSLTVARFEWGTSPGFGLKTPEQTLPTGTSTITVDAVISPLACGTTYYYRAVSSNANGTGFGASRSFSTVGCVGSPPAAVTNPADQITDHSARFLGAANPNGGETQAYFEWGQNTSYGSATSRQILGAGTAQVAVQQPIQGLHCSLDYNFRLVAENAGGVTKGANQLFRTLPCPGSFPLSVTVEGNGSVTSNPAGLHCPSTCSVSFEANLRVELRAVAGVGATFAGWQGDSDCSDGTVQMAAARSCTAVFSGGGPPIIVSTGSPRDVSASSARLMGSVTSDGSQTTAYFRWGKTATYGQSTRLIILPAAVTPVPIEETISGLECSTSYHFRAVAANVNGSGEGEDRVFTTDECVGSAPQATTGAADSITASSARLHALVDTGLQATAAYFEWGQTLGYGSVTPTQHLASATAPLALSHALQGLVCGLTYHFRAVAENPGGLSRGADASFRTSPCADSARLTVSIEGGGGVRSSPEGISCPGVCSESFAKNLAIRLLPLAEAGWEFESWLGDSDCVDGIVSVNADRVCIARFERRTVPSFAVSVSKRGSGTGTVQSSPVGITCGPDCSDRYERGTAVDLRATAAQGSRFSDWSGPADCADGRVTVLGDTNCIATFERSSKKGFVLTVAKGGSGSGFVTSDPGGIECGSYCSHEYAAGRSVRLTATPSPGSQFIRWSGDADCSDGRVTMKANRSCTASFRGSEPATYALGVAKAGSGTITSKPAGISCGTDCGHTYGAGALVTLTPTAAAGSTFSGWSGDADCADGKLIMTENLACVGTFSVKGGSPVLNVGREGEGTGVVTSAPAGINCGADCSESFPHGSVVSLTATPAHGSSFVKWLGDTDCADGRVTVKSTMGCRAVFALRPTKVFLLHGIAQEGYDMEPLAGDLIKALKDSAPGRFDVILPAFDWGACAKSRDAACSIVGGAVEFSRFVREHSSAGDSIALIGYSMGGLIAREFLSSSGVASTRRTVLLVTLGTPNRGYPFCEGDVLFRNDSLALEMASHWRVAAAPYLSSFLQELERDWVGVARPEGWLAAAGTYCDESLRSGWESIGLPCVWTDIPPYAPQGCAEGDTNDGVVCSRSALFDGGAGSGPTSYCASANYRHTPYGWVVFSCSTFDKLDLFQPPPGSGLFEAIRNELLQAGRSKPSGPYADCQDPDFSLLSHDDSTVKELIGKAIDAGFPTPRDGAYVLARSRPEIVMPILAGRLKELESGGNRQSKEAILEVIAYAANREAVVTLGALVDEQLAEPQWIDRAMDYSAGATDVVSLVYTLIDVSSGQGAKRGAAWLARHLEKGRFVERWEAEVATRYGKQQNRYEMETRDPVARARGLFRRRDGM